MKNAGHGPCDGERDVEKLHEHNRGFGSTGSDLSLHGAEGGMRCPLRRPTPRATTFRRTAIWTTHSIAGSSTPVEYCARARQRAWAGMCQTGAVTARVNSAIAHTCTRASKWTA